MRKTKARSNDSIVIAKAVLEAAILGGGDAFIERINALVTAKSEAESALAALKLGEDVAAVQAPSSREGNRAASPRLRTQ
jgi:hypothetical protein